MRESVADLSYHPGCYPPVVLILFRSYYASAPEAEVFISCCSNRYCSYLSNSSSLFHLLTVELVGRISPFSNVKRIKPQFLCYVFWLSSYILCKMTFIVVQQVNGVNVTTLFILKPICIFFFHTYCNQESAVITCDYKVQAILKWLEPSVAFDVIFSLMCDWCVYIHRWSVEINHLFQNTVSSYCYNVWHQTLKHILKLAKCPWAFYMVFCMN